MTLALAGDDFALLREADTADDDSVWVYEQSDGWHRCWNMQSAGLMNAQSIRQGVRGVEQQFQITPAGRVIV